MMKHFHIKQNGAVLFVGLTTSPACKVRPWKNEWRVIQEIAW